MTAREYDVIIIGAGATGCGIARDLSLRGVKCIVIEKDDIASGATGRNHGLLHSGARYAVKDIESARECISENIILKKIASHCIEETGGLFVTLPEDDPSYQSKLLEGCRLSGIKAREISIKKALELEPNLNPEIMSAIHVPDGTIDPFRLASANMLDASNHGAKIVTHTRITGIIKKNSVVHGVKCRNRAGDTFSVFADIIINASGVWGEQIAMMAGIKLKMHPSKGTMLIFDYRVNNIVVNRCRTPMDGDIIVPGDTVSIIGTTSKKVDFRHIEEVYPEDDEISVLLKDGEKLIPNISKTRLLRAYSGVRPLVAVSGNTKGREISRGIVLIDHSEKDGLDGFITIAGGKLMTYRLMAEMASDMVCAKLKVRKKCSTHKEPLPGSEVKSDINKSIKKFIGLPESVVGSTLFRHGQALYSILNREKKNFRVICECEMVTEGEIEYAVKKLNVHDIVDLRRRTRIGMGPCQGELCAYRAAGLFKEFSDDEVESTRLLYDFLEERWKGIRPVMWGDTLRESEFTYWIYQGLLGLGDTGKYRE